MVLSNHCSFLFSDAFDTEKLLSSMDMLKHGKAVDIPKYDFKSYKNNVFPARRVTLSLFVGLFSELCSPRHMPFNMFLI